MLRFILRRLLQIIPLIVGITFISFGVMKLAPGDFLTQMQSDPHIRPAAIARLRHDFGLDKPWYIQYGLWLWNALHGNFGQSFAYHQPVFQLIGHYVEATLLLAVTSIVFAWAIAIPMGVYAATHRNGFGDRLMSLIAFSGISLPGFFVALMAMLWASKTGWLPVGGYSSPTYDQMSPLGKFLDIAEHLILPTIVLGTRELATILRQMRGNLLDVLSEN
jgi:peptide/nickel transport system permease protein